MEKNDLVTLNQKFQENIAKGYYNTPNYIFILDAVKNIYGEERVSWKFKQLFNDTNKVDVDNVEFSDYIKTVDLEYINDGSRSLKPGSIHIGDQVIITKGWDNWCSSKMDKYVGMRVKVTSVNGNTIEFAEDTDHMIWNYHQGHYILDSYYWTDKIDDKDFLDYAALPFLEIVIHFPEVSITNNAKEKHLMRDIYAKHVFSINGLMIDHLELARSTFTYSELLGYYCHSHVPSLSNGAACSEYKNFCLGRGILSELSALLSAEYDELNVNAYFLTLIDALSWESLEGGPYRTMHDIVHRRGTSESAYSTYIESSDNSHKLAQILLQRPEFVRALEIRPVVTEEGNFYEARVNNPNVYILADSLLNFYAPEELLANTPEVIIRTDSFNNPLFSIRKTTSESTVLNNYTKYEGENSYINFKGEHPPLRFIDDNIVEPDDTCQYIINPNITLTALSIINKLLKINYATNFK